MAHAEIAILREERKSTQRDKMHSEELERYKSLVEEARAVMPYMEAQMEADKVSIRANK